LCVILVLLLIKDVIPYSFRETDFEQMYGGVEQLTAIRTRMFQCFTEGGQRRHGHHDPLHVYISYKKSKNSSLAFN